MCDIKFHKPGTTVFALVTAGMAGKTVKMGVVGKVVLTKEDTWYTLSGDGAVYHRNTYLTADEAFAANLK